MVSCIQLVTIAFVDQQHIFRLLNSFLPGRFKNNGQNFQVQLSGKGHRKQSASVSGNPNVDLPEDLVQIQAYLRWERKGRQSYTTDQEKVSQYFLGL